MKKYTLFLILIAGTGIFYNFWPAYRLEHALSSDGAATANGVIEYQRKFTKPATADNSPASAPYYEVGYRFEASGETLQGQHQCQCQELASFRAGNAIHIRYDRSKPSVNIPAVIHYNGAWLLAGTITGFGLIFISLLGFLFKIIGVGNSKKPLYVLTRKLLGD